MEEVSKAKKGQKKFPILVIFGLVLFFVAISIFSKFASAATSPAIITYQGKLLISSKLATTTQNMAFILFDALTGGNILYTASGTIASPQQVSTTPNQGLFSINLGDTGTNALSQAIFQNNGSVFLEVRIGSDTLTPRKQITAVPYALNARYLDGVGVNTISSTAYIPQSDTSGNFTFNSTTITTSTISNITATNATSTNLNISSLANILQLGINTSSPISQLSVQGTGLRNPFSILSSTNASMLTILTNGRVGINSSTPIDTLGVQGGLQVVGGVTTTNLSVSGSTNLILTGTAGQFPYYAANGFSLTNTSTIFITPTRRIGIGTTTPQSKLTIQGTGSENPFSIVSSTADATSILTVLTNGNVGINSSTPSTRLAVEGNSYFSQTSTFGGNVSNLIDSNTVISQVSSTGVGTTPFSIFVSGRYAYVTNQSDNTISVVDISNPSAPRQIATTSVGVLPIGIYVSGRYAYVANNTDNAISVVDISNPSSPRQVATTSVGTGPASLYVSGRYAYVGNADSFSVVDISNPLAPRQIATTSAGGSVATVPQSLYVSGRYAYTVNNNSLYVIDISNPSAPRQIATTTVGSQTLSVSVSGRYAYVTNFDTGPQVGTLSVVDISNPAAPTVVASTSLSAVSLASIFVSGRYAYVSDNSAAIYIFDISNPSSSPRVVGNYAVGSSPQGIFVSGRYAYVANSGANTISVLDISGTEVTSLMAHSAEVGNIQSRNDIFAQGNIMAGTGLMVGSGGIMSQGSLQLL